MSNIHFSCRKAKETDMVDYLHLLGHQPSKMSRDDYWYLSPFREEKSPSFKVNRQKNIWFDFGTGEGGTIIDFGIKYHDCTISEFLERLNKFFSFDQPSFSKYKAVQKEKEEEGDHYRLSVHDLTNKALLQYLKERNIVDTAIIHSRLKELHVKYANGKGYFMIGFPNDKGGWAARNKYFKGAFGHQGTTFINQFSGAQKLILFEGFMDALSFLQMMKRKPKLFSPDMKGSNILVLNSLNNLAQSEPIFSGYSRIYTLLDMDKSGQEWTKILLASDSKFMNRSSLFSPYKDLNEWHVSQRSTRFEDQRKKTKRGLKI